MASALQFEDASDTSSSQKTWGLHNGVVVLAAVGLVVLSLLVQLLQYTPLLEGAPQWLFSLVGQISHALLLGAGAVIGMLIGTRILQTHISTRGARLLTL